MRALAFIGGVLSGLLFAGTAQAEVPTLTFSKTSSGVTLSASIPASGPFTVQYLFETKVAEASLRVWPNALSACAEGPPTEGERQTYHLPLALETEADKTVGTTSVPHLQVAQKFCFRFSWTALHEPDPQKLEQAFQGKLIATPGEAAALADQVIKAAAKGFCILPGQSEPDRPECQPIDPQPLYFPLLKAALDAKVIESETRSLALAVQGFQAQIDGLLAAPNFGAPPQLEAHVPSRVWAKGDISPERLAAALQAVKANKKDLPRADDMETWLGKLGDFAGRMTDANAQRLAAELQLKPAKEAAFAAQAKAAFDFLATNLRARVDGTPILIAAQVSDFKNYLSPEIGIALALPFLPDSDASLVPYAGVNVYFTPVDRQLSLGDLVKPFFQRFSLTVGLALSQSLQSHEVDFKPTVAETFALVGAGYRILPFARLSGLLFIAEAAPSGGLSGESELVLAGAVAVSADIDVVAYISSSLAK